MNLRKNKKIHFFTLLEVMVSMGVFCVLMLALMQFFSTAQSVWEKTGNRTELFDSARIVNQLLSQDLNAAFYGEPEHDMTKYRFFSYKDESSDSTAPRVQLTFAVFREGEENHGLTEVNYLWNVTTQKLSCFAIPETDSTNGILKAAENGWVTRVFESGDPKTINQNKWIETIRSAAKTEDDKASANSHAILDNVLLFSMRAKEWYNNGGTTELREWNSDLDNKTDRETSVGRPPYFVNITLAVLSQDGYEKLETMIKARLGKSADVRGTIKTEFDYLRNSHEYFAPADIDRVDDTKTGIPVEKRLIFENTQFFKTMVTIER